MVHVRLEEIENYAKENNVPIMLKEGINFLVDYIEKNNIKNILEIGTAIGYSSIKMALVSKNVNITTIERNENMYATAIKNIKEFNLENQIKVILSDALDVKIDKQFDLIFIDAAKSKYIKFFEKFKNNLNENGVIVTDNLYFHGLVLDDSKTNNRNTKQLVRHIREYIEFLKNNSEFKTEFIDLGDGIAITSRSEI